MHPMLLLLTCANEQEAQKITNILLEQRLVACVKHLKTTSHFLWQGKQEQSDEVLLFMETLESHYDIIHQQIKQHHSYVTFVLQGIAIAKLSQQAQIWLHNELCC